ncbi:hypothetical protein L208DRAFT_1293165 [Tricholoma matsutake]|nr:hypothetical protein L208DRAFT_1293165 [Tricholoma matsutake 945]
MLRLDPARYSDQASWDAAQLENWRKVANAAVKPLPKTFNTYTRFYRPVSPVTFYFTPDETIITIKEFEGLVTRVLKAFPEDAQSYKVVTRKEASGPLGLKLVGSHFFQFYDTWMKPSDYETICKDRETSKLPRDFPGNEAKDQEPFDEIQKKLDPNVPKDNSDTAPGIGINSNKFRLANLAERRGYADQRNVMKNTSATYLSNKLWEKQPPKAKPVAEWLHRSAFRFGGLGDTTNVASSQTPGNLIFGTKECNTHMIRAENTISNIVFNETGVTGLLTTTNVREGKINRITARGDRTPTDIPSWTKTQMYSWLCFRLDYQWVMDSMLLNQSYNVSATFDPWSRYVPLKLEAHIDDALVDHLYSLIPGQALVYQAPMTFSQTGSTPFSPSSLRSLSTMSAQALEAISVWTAVKAGNTSVIVEGIEILNPRIPSMPGELHSSIVSIDRDDAHVSQIQRVPSTSSALDSLPNDPGYVVEGEIKLFGIPTLIAVLEKWMGDPPPDVVVGKDPPRIERATLKDDFHLSQVVPQLEGTVFDDIIFRNVAFYYQNYAFDKTKAVGWHFNADWVIDHSCGFLYQFLSETLNVRQPVLSIHASLGLRQRWDSLLNVHSVTLEGVFPDLTFSPIEGLCFTSIGVRLLGIRELSFRPDPHYILKFGFGVFGTMDLDVPSSVVPLKLDYDMTAIGKTIRLSAEVSGGVWSDPLGVEGLWLQDVQFAASFSVASPWKSLAFEVSATFQYKLTSAILLGSFAIGGPFELTAMLQNIDAIFVNDVFELISCEMLTLPEFDLKIESAVISIASGVGLSINLTNIAVAGYQVANAMLTISSTGVVLFGKLTGQVLEFDEVEIRDPFLKIAFASSGSQKKSDVMVGGVVDFLHLRLTVAAHLYRWAGRTEWAILAELSAQDETLALSKIVPDVKDTFLDLALKNVLFVVASQDDPSLEAVTETRYMIRKGVQFCATIDQIKTVDDLIRQPVLGLVLRIGWSKRLGFNMDVFSPAELTIGLGNGIRTTPIRLGIITKPSVELSVSAGLSISVANSPDPLTFSLILAANMTGASAIAEMRGWLHKPFGLANVSIGPAMALSIQIIYAQFIVTGIPSGFGVSGGLRIGDLEVQLAINISEDPRRQLLSGKVEKLNVGDLVTFASKLVDASIPDVPADFLKFEDVNLYICPAGLSIGSTVYPQGFSFAADVVIFGKRANIACVVSEADRQIRIDGGVDNFTLGPLSVQGLHGPRAEISCIMGTMQQYLYIDGTISLFDVKTETSVELQLLPKPMLMFHAQLQFTDLFLIRLDAELIGAVSFADLSNSDFSFDAELQNTLLEYIRQQIMEQMHGAVDVADAGIEAAQQKVDEAQREWEKGVKQAEQELENKYREWQTHNDTVRNKSQPVIDNYLRSIRTLQQDIDRKRKEYQTAMDNARRAVKKANDDRAAAMAIADRNIVNARTEMDRQIDNAQRALDNATRDLNRAFGDAQRGINDARRKVQSLQNQINALWRIVHDYERASWLEFWKKAAIPGLRLSIRVLEAAKAIADGVLRVAQDVLKSAAFLSKEGAVRIAREALEAARRTGNASLAAAREALRTVDRTSQAVVKAAEDTLKGVERGVEYTAFQGAIQALETFKNVNEAMYKAAVVAIESLMESAEYIAYQLAKDALTLAKSATTILDGAREMLELAKKASREALEALRKVIDFGTKAIDIQLIKLSGTLRGIVGAGGQTTKPLSAKVKGYFLGRYFELDAAFNPSDVVTFITSIFNA